MRGRVLTEQIAITGKCRLILRSILKGFLIQKRTADNAADRVEPFFGRSVLLTHLSYLLRITTVFIRIAVISVVITGVVQRLHVPLLLPA